MIRVHKILLYPNNKQTTHFTKACGVARFAYNWGLTEWKRRYEADEIMKESKLWKTLSAVKREQYPWMHEITNCVPYLAIKNDLSEVIRNYLEKQGEFPKYRKKGVHDSFSLEDDHFETKEKKVWIPLLGWVNMAEELRFDGKIIGAVISKIANKWYIAIRVEMPDTKPMYPSEHQAIGINFGTKPLATLSDGSVVGEVKASKQCESKLRRLNLELSRRKGARQGEKKSRNFGKTKRKISRLYTKIANIRADETHRYTSRLTSENTLIGIEDFDVRGMIINHSIMRGIADMSFYEFLRQLEYKATAMNTRIIVANKWFPSDKWCNVCDSVNEQSEHPDSEWICEECGAHHNRDVNAAMNLRDYAIRVNYQREKY